MNYLKAEVMEMCHREGLYQKDLLNGSKERVTEREYWAQKKGQLALDSENAARAAEKLAPIAEYPDIVHFGRFWNGAGDGVRAGTSLQRD